MTHKLVASMARVAIPSYSASPLSAYEEWRASYVAASKTSGNRIPSAALLRRMVQLRRAGDSFAEIARCCGTGRNVMHDAWERLPEHLR